MAWLVGGSSTLDPGRCGDISFRHAIKCNASCRFEDQIFLLGSSTEMAAVIRDLPMYVVYPAVLVSFLILGWHGWCLPGLQSRFVAVLFWKEAWVLTGDCF
jgi:hypothetical protein